MTSSKTSNIQQLHIFYTPAVVVGGENLLSSAMGEECSKDNTSGTVRGFLPRKCLSILPSIKTCRNAGVHRGPSRLLSVKILIYLPVLRKISLSL